LNITSGLREVQFPRKNSPRETELRIFSELKLNLGKMRAEQFSVKFLLIAPSRRRERSVVDRREKFRKRPYQVRSTIN